VQLNREVSELESLIESKIYREDELETRLAELERELSRRRVDTAPQTDAASSDRPSHSRQPSHADSTTGANCVKAPMIWMLVPCSRATWVAQTRPVHRTGECRRASGVRTAR